MSLRHSGHAGPTAHNGPRGRSGPPVETDGAVQFSRYAFPPNVHGYCGPDRAGEMLERVSEGASGRALAEVARGFAGAWPYLELIGECLGRPPLDAAVVETYWLGGPLLDRCGGAPFLNSLEARFQTRLTRLEFERLAAAVRAGATPHHNFHVFGVYPWVGLLREGSLEAPMEVLDNCRIRWGQVMEVGDEVAAVTSQHLLWDGRRLSLGPYTSEVARYRRDGHALSRPFEVGDWVSLHWDWVCDRLSFAQLSHLRASTAHELDAVTRCSYSAPASVLA